MSLVGKNVGNYVIERKLGEGGMGDVYVAKHPTIGRSVAIKVLKADLRKDEDAVGRFFNEAKAVAALRHPHIVDITDFGSVDDHAYFQMELLEGEDLGQRLDAVGLTVEEGRRVILQCCDALAACHEHGIIHRDLKPENIFLVGPRHRALNVKLLDFGLAKLTRKEGNSVKTLTGQVFGTPLYTSPEQAAGGSKTVGPEADIYALGVILYELWTGRVPFNGETMTEILVGHLEKQPRPPSTWNPHLTPAHDQLILRALQKRPEDRFRSTAELAEALGDLASGRAPRAVRPSPATATASVRDTQRDVSGVTATQERAHRNLSVRRAQPVPARAPLLSRHDLRRLKLGVVVVSAILSGGTLGLVARSMLLEKKRAAPPVAALPNAPVPTVAAPAVAPPPPPPVAVAPPKPDPVAAPPAAPQKRKKPRSDKPTSHPLKDDLDIYRPKF